MEGIKKYIFIGNLLLVLVVFNFMIFQKEQIIANGELILLELYPIDPRSLMQGDYMILAYEISRWDLDKEGNEVPEKGFCVLTKDEKNIGTYLRFQTAQTPIKEGEIALKYHKTPTGLRIGAESFLFQEGKAKIYEKAKYGGLRVKNGTPLLVALYDKDGVEIIDN